MEWTGIKQTRLHNARLLQKSVGGQKGMIEKTGRSQSQLSALMGDNAYKPIGEKIARSLEEDFSLPIGWLDTWHDSLDEPTTSIQDETRESSARYSAYTKFGHRIKQARDHANLTQEQLAERVRRLAGTENFKQQSLQKIEAGQIQSSGYVALIAEATGTNGVWLTTGKGSMHEQPSKPHTKELTTEQIELLRALISRIERLTLTGRGTTLNSQQKARIIAGSFSAAIKNGQTAETLEDGIFDAALNSVI
ncbi:MAG: helix-turn-helix domain-containing protein [Amphritea sp.]|nr:helix-turn-helix domain-containing protein [Amphritea sp.]